MNKKKIGIYLISAMGLGGILYYIAKKSKSGNSDFDDLGDEE